MTTTQSATARPQLAKAVTASVGQPTEPCLEPHNLTTADVYFGRAETILNGWANVRLRNRAHVEHRIARVVEIHRGVIDEIL